MSEKFVLFAAPGRVAAPAVPMLMAEGWKIAISHRKGGSSETEARRIKSEHGEDVQILAADLATPEGAADFYDQSTALLGSSPPGGRLALVNVASRYPEAEDFSRWESTGRIEKHDWKYFASNFEVMRCISKVVLERAKYDQGRRLDIVSFVDARSQRYFDEKILHPMGRRRCLDFDFHEDKGPGMELLRKAGVSSRDSNPYLLSKLLIAYATRELALDYPGARINAIAPGVMSASPGMSDEKASELAMKISLTGEVPGHQLAADTIFYLLEMCSNMTGNILFADGGMHLKWNHLQNLSTKPQILN